MRSGAEGSIVRLKEEIYAFFSSVVIRREVVTEDYALLDVEAAYHHYRIKLTEVIDREGRKYSYYLFYEHGEFIAGLDNAADPTAVRLRYEKESKKHYGTRVPHKHAPHKEDITLTEEISFEGFREWIVQTVQTLEGS